MRDYLDIGCTPADEPCEQVGPNCNYPKMRLECRVFIGQLRRIFGPEPEGADLRVKGFSHDFGTYYEVVCYFDCDNKAAVEYAYRCENIPASWDQEAKEELAAWTRQPQ